MAPMVPPHMEREMPDYPIPFRLELAVCLAPLVVFAAYLAYAVTL
jgi:hypothetical protein